MSKSLGQLGIMSHRLKRWYLEGFAQRQARYKVDKSGMRSQRGVSRIDKEEPGQIQNTRVSQIAQTGVMVKLRSSRQNRPRRPSNAVLNRMTMIVHAKGEYQSFAAAATVIV